jgi:hypothetical protein
MRTTEYYSTYVTYTATIDQLWHYKVLRRKPYARPIVYCCCSFAVLRLTCLLCTCVWRLACTNARIHVRIQIDNQSTLPLTLSETNENVHCAGTNVPSESLLVLLVLSPLLLLLLSLLYYCEHYCSSSMAFFHAELWSWNQTNAANDQRCYMIATITSYSY